MSELSGLNLELKFQKRSKILLIIKCQHNIYRTSDVKIKYYN